MVLIEETLTQSLGTVEDLGIVAMAKPFCGQSTNRQKFHRGEPVLI